MSTLRFTLLLATISLLIQCSSKEEKDAPKKQSPIETIIEKKATPEPEVAPEPVVVEAPVIKEEPIPSRFAFSNEGKYCVQVASGRVDKNVESRLMYWKNEGFSNAYISTYTDEQTQEMWYRLRIGRFTKLKEAKAAAIAVSEQYGIQAWADNSTSTTPAQ